MKKNKKEIDNMIKNLVVTSGIEKENPVSAGVFTIENMKKMLKQERYSDPSINLVCSQKDWDWYVAQEEEYRKYMAHNIVVRFFIRTYQGIVYIFNILKYHYESK